MCARRADVLTIRTAFFVGLVAYSVMFLKQKSRSYYNNLNRAKPECYTIVTTQKKSGKTFSKNFHFRGHLPPKSEIEIGQTGTSLRAGYRSQDAL